MGTIFEVANIIFEYPVSLLMISWLISVHIFVNLIMNTLLTKRNILGIEPKFHCLIKINVYINLFFPFGICFVSVLGGL